MWMVIKGCWLASYEEKQRVNNDTVIEAMQDLRARVNWCSDEQLDKIFMEAKALSVAAYDEMCAREEFDSE